MPTPPAPRSPRAGVAAALLLALPLLLGAAAVMAGGFTPRGTQPPVTYGVLSPNDCSTCHGNYAPGSHHEPHPTWAGSMMANASRDPIFWAALDVANNDIPGVGDFCLRCHVPTGWLAGRSEPPGGTADGCGLAGDIDSDEGDFSGLSCEFCHRMMVNDAPPPGEDPAYTENGEYWIDDEDCPEGSGPCRRGPYTYPPGTPPPGFHPWAYSAYHTESTICGNCHNVTSPATTLIDEQGNDTTIPFPIERTYAEWQQSGFSSPPGAISCQGCHMPDAAGNPVYACSLGQNNRAGQLPIHQFAGGNAWVPDVLAGEYPSLGRAASYAATRDWALDMLQNRSAEMALAAPFAVDPEGTLALDVRVTNLAGHKLPTGYGEGRRMWLQVEVRDAQETLVATSGAYDTSTGVLGTDPQLKVYHREAGIWNRNGTAECDVADLGGNPFFHFVLGDCVRVDNRIPPLGFTGAEDDETRPVGYVYPETAPGSGVLVNYDDTAYAFALPPGLVSPLTVSVRLYYQTVSKEYVEFLRDQAVTHGFPDDCISRSTGPLPAGTSRGELLHQLWLEYGRAAPVEMEVASRQVVIAESIFADGFESGGTAAWSSTTP